MNTETTSGIVQPVLFLTAAVLVYAVAISLSGLRFTEAYPELAVGITYDLAFAAPLFYFLAIRKTRIPNTTVAGVAVLGLVTTALLLPADQQTHLAFITKWILPVGELGLLGFVGYKTWLGIRVFRRERSKNADVHLVLNSVFADLLGPTILSRAAAFEASTLYYAFLKWRRPNRSGTTFTYHQSRGTGAIYGVIGFLIIAETIALHVIVSMWSPVAAWILTASSIYVLVLLLAQYKSSYLRPIEVEDGILKVRCGLFCDADIPISEIESFKSCGHSAPLPKDVLQAALLKGFEPVNLAVTTSAETKAHGPYGIASSFRSIAFFVDEKERLITHLENNDA